MNRSVQEHRQYHEIEWSCCIVGSKHARVLIFLERAAIKTTLSPKAYVELCSELQGEKWVSLKPPLATPQSCGHVRSSPKVISKEGASTR
jgi:hypothetical protein